MDNGDLTNLSPKKGALMTTEFIGVQVRFSDRSSLAAAGLTIPETFLLQMPAQAIPIANDFVVLKDYAYADGTPVILKVGYRAFEICSKTHKCTPMLDVQLVPTLALGGE